MRVLVACEFSGTVRDAFARRGHEAWSCDLLPTEKPGNHIEGDVLDNLGGLFVCSCGYSFPEFLGKYGCANCEADGIARRVRWDLMIAHPPCTYLTCSAEWAYSDGPYHQKVKPDTLTGEARRAARDEAVAFVKRLAAAPIEHIGIENPVGVLSSRWRDPDQFIQPYEYGDDASKKTCLWLKNLPLLKPTGLSIPRLAASKGGRSYSLRWGDQTDSGQNRESPGADRWKTRSLTWPGWAEAMADQWGSIS